MELIWASDEFVLGGRPYQGFPIILTDNMESFIPANEFFRHYLLRGAIGSKRSWPSTGRAMYDFLSFLQAHELDWRDVDRGESKTLLAAYRDYSKNECGLATSTIRQRLHYICRFYMYALNQGWVSRLPFALEERTVSREKGFLAHVDGSGGKAMANDVMPRKHAALPKFLSIAQVKSMTDAIVNPHHLFLVRFALRTGLRREELATFPLAYIFDPERAGRNERNIKITLDPTDGHGIRTKGNKIRDIYISRKLMVEAYKYLTKSRGERSSLLSPASQTLFVNQFGQPYANDGKGIERIVRACGAKVGIKTHPHMLRHTYATHTLVMLQRNKGTVEPLVFLQRQLGHSSIQTTMIYLHLVNDVADSAVLAYDEELNEGIESV